MARFRGTLQGARGEASRLGNGVSGLRVSCNGWNQGVTVSARAEESIDIFNIAVTGGSNHPEHRLTFECTNYTLRAGRGWSVEDAAEINNILAKYDRAKP